MESDGTGCTVTESRDSPLSQTMDSSTVTVNRKGCRALSVGVRFWLKLTRCRLLTFSRLLHAPLNNEHTCAHGRPRSLGRKPYAQSGAAEGPQVASQ